ncbi:UNVERIFIED_CONTAM: hypothetical protein Sindi_1446900 [Sesamum indicum]
MANIVNLVVQDGLKGEHETRQNCNIGPVSIEGWQNWDSNYKTGNFSPVSIDFLAILVLPAKIAKKRGGDIWGLGFRRPRAQFKHIGVYVANDMANDVDEIEIRENQQSVPPLAPPLPPPPLKPLPPPPAAKFQFLVEICSTIHWKKSGTTKEIAIGIASLYKG